MCGSLRIELARSCASILTQWRRSSSLLFVACLLLISFVSRLSFFVSRLSFFVFRFSFFVFRFSFLVSSLVSRFSSRLSSLWSLFVLISHHFLSSSLIRLSVSIVDLEALAPIKDDMIAFCRLKNELKDYVGIFPFLLCPTSRHE